MSAKSGKKKGLIIFIVAVVLVGVIGGSVFLGNSKNQTAQSKGSVEQVKKRTIANSISGNGTVESANVENVKGNSMGLEVETIHVKEGDIVEAGALICTFNTESIEEQIQTVKENIADRKKDKKEQLAEYDKQIADREKSNTEQKENLLENLEETRAELLDAQTELRKEEIKYDNYLLEEGHSENDVEALQMQILIENKKMNVETIEREIDSYESQIEYMEEQDTSSLKEAKQNYANQMNDVIANLEEQLEDLEEQKANALVYATVGGTVTAVNASAGNTFFGDSIVTIESVDQFVIEAQVEEYDIPDIAVGMKVLIKTDATREQELEGEIIYIAPRATNSGTSSMNGISGIMGMEGGSLTGGSGTATYLVKIALKEQNARLRLGMNAKTSIIIQESADVWSVPYDAIYTREDGSTYLEQVTGKDEEGNLLTKELEVEVGIQGTYYVEVISEQIAEGIEILVPDAQGNSSIEELLNMMGADAGI